MSDPLLFDALVQYIIIDNAETGEPYEITFVYKSGFESVS